MKIRRLTAFALVLCVAVSVSCARTPSNKSSQHIVKGYFNKYGKKFKTSEFGAYKLDSVSVIDIVEIHKGLVAATSEIKFVEGPSYMVRCMIEKRSFGWKLVSWEKI